MHPEHINDHINEGGLPLNIRFAEQPDDPGCDSLHSRPVLVVLVACGEEECPDGGDHREEDGVLFRIDVLRSVLLEGVDLLVEPPGELREEQREVEALEQADLAAEYPLLDVTTL